MLIPISQSRPGSSYRMVSPLVSHHHFSSRRRPGLGQPAAVWLARKRLYNPWDRLARGLGQLSYEKAREIMMFGATRGYTDEQIREASQVVYPARTAEGALVSAARIEAGEFTAEGEPAAGERAVVSTALAIPPKVVRAPRPPLYTDFENCIPGDQVCIDRNGARAAANQAILTNAGHDYNRAVCERNCALNTRSGHPEHCRDCATQFARIPVPPAPGTRKLIDPTTQRLSAPRETSATSAARQTAARETAARETAARETAARETAARETAAGAEGESLTERIAGWIPGEWMMESSAVGVPNWVLIVGAAAAGLLILGKDKGRR